jgi:recombination protein RecT
MEKCNMSTSTAIAKTPYDTVRDQFKAMEKELVTVLPKHLTPERMTRIALNCIRNVPKLLECDRQSLLAAIMRASQLGLEPDGVLGQAYLIPYGKQVQFIVGYRGLIDLARRSGEVSNIVAREVYANDTFTINWADEIPFKHEPLLRGERGEITHFWALARFKDGGFHWDYMTVGEVEAVRDKSQGYQAAAKWKKGDVIESPWTHHFVEMGKKTVIRRIAKFLPMSVQRATVTEDLAEAGKAFSVDQFGDVVIEGESQEVQKAGTLAQLNAEIAAQAAQQPAPHDPVTGEIIEETKAAAQATLVEGDVVNVPTAEELKAMRHATQEEAQAKAQAILNMLAAGYTVSELRNVLGGGFEIVLTKAGGEVEKQIRAIEKQTA